MMRSEKGEKILVGISGGIDSTATILMLQERGYSVEALYVDMLDCEVSRGKVRQLSDRLSMKLHIANAVSEFQEKVVGKVISEHQNGRTPSPCTLCNPLIKWNILKEYADKLGIYWLATGHYVNVVERGGRYFISKGVDVIKDQSYYLYNMGQEILSRAVTPLGNFTKLKVREYLASKNFVELATGGESQGVCFAKSGYRDFLVRNCQPLGGEVVNESGEIVGRHDGFQLYTIGQKRGFELFDDSKKYEVVAVDSLNNMVVVGAPLLTSEIILKDSWIQPFDDSPLTIKIRGLGKNPAESVDIEIMEDGMMKVTLPSEKFWAQSVGQPAVIFQGDIVVGGGICK